MTESGNSPREGRVQKEDSAREREELLSNFFPNVALQLRTALSNLYLAVDALVPADARDFDSAMDRKLAVLDLNYYRLLRLSGNLSAAAELKAPMPLPGEDRDIVAETASVCRRAESLAALLGLTLRFRCREESHLCALHRDAVERILFQLLSNAFKFTPQGGEVTVELRMEDGWISLCVSDTGCGIPAERIPTLYDRYLYPEQRDLPPHGLGLGLPICRHLAEGHGGRILAESKEGKGCRITVLLPDRQTGRLALSDYPADYGGGFNPTLLGLADALPADAFRGKNQ